MIEAPGKATINPPALGTPQAGRSEAQKPPQLKLFLPTLFIICTAPVLILRAHKLATPFGRVQPCSRSLKSLATCSGAPPLSQLPLWELVVAVLASQMPAFQVRVAIATVGCLALLLILRDISYTPTMEKMICTLKSRQVRVM